MDNLEFVYSLFNQFLFLDAKNNISALQYYFDTNFSTSGNKLVGELVKAVKDYDLASIDIPLLNSIMMKTGKTPDESNKIIGEIVKWKQFDRKQIEPAKKFLEEIIAGSIIQKANNLFPNQPSEFLKYIKNSEIKTSNSETLNCVSFSQLDINFLIASGSHDIIPSSFNFVNRSFSDNGYEKGQMVLISMPPGCFTGDTEIYLSNGDTITLEELYKSNKINIPVFSIDDNNFIKSTAERCILTKEVDNLIEIHTFDGGIIKSTTDHLYMVISGDYKKAEDLKVGDVLMPFSLSNKNIDEYSKLTKIVSIKKIELLNPEPVYDIVNVNIYNNFAIKTSNNVGVFVHNCGKSLAAGQEALFMASKGYKVHYLVLGDLQSSDFIIRLSSIYSGLSFRETKNNINTIYNGLCQLLGDRLQLTILPAGVITVDEYVDFIKDKDYDVLIVDYDSNFKADFSENSMYNTYGEIYEKLTRLTAKGFLLFVLSQSKICSWKSPEIDLSEIGESSRKQHTADVIITRGREPECPNHLGIFKIVKNRRGNVDTKDYSIRLNNGRFMSIPKAVYDQLKQETEEKDYTIADIEGMITQYKSQFNNITKAINQAQNNRNSNNGMKVSGPTPFNIP